MTMEIRIAGRIVAASDVTHNAEDIGFGRFDSDAIEVSPYSLTLATDEVERVLAEPYERTCAEVRLDDLTHDDTSAFTRVGYCGLREAIASHPGPLAEIIRTYHLRDLLDGFLPREAWTYVINSVESIEITSETVVLEGRCFRYVGRPGASRVP